MKNYKNLFSLFLTIMLYFFSSCDDFLEEAPVDSIIDGIAIIDNETAESALAAVYASYQGRLINSSFAYLADDIDDIPRESDFAFNEVLPTSLNISPTWNSAYLVVIRVNSFIEEISQTDLVDQELKSQLIAEALVLRALAYTVYLIPYWGDVPYVIGTDIESTRLLSRIPSNEIMANLVEDIQDNIGNLKDEFSGNEETRTRVTRGAASAVLARLHLFLEQWSEAENWATEVINNPLYVLQADIEGIFLRNSEESILELYSDLMINQGLGQGYYPESLGGVLAYVPTDNIMNSFETGDLRANSFLSMDAEGIVFVNKFRDVGQDGSLQEIKEIRISEMYLIRAEARAKLGNISTALEDLNIVRNRAGLPNSSADEETELLLAIEQERFIELSFEGHRWYDLQRTGRIDEVMSQFNPNWEARDRLLPLPQGEVDLNPNLLPQNPGY